MFASIIVAVLATCSLLELKDHKYCPGRMVGNVRPTTLPEQEVPSVPFRDPKQSARVAGLVWNQRQLSPGMGGRLGLEYAVNV